jgi:hypothetical protein
VQIVAVLTFLSFSRVPELSLVMVSPKQVMTG